MNWLVITVVAIIGLFAFKGHRIGFIKTVFSMFSIIIVLFLTTIINPYINGLFHNNERINEAVRTGVSKMFFESEENEEIKNGKSNEKKAIEAMPLPDSIKDALIKNNNTEVHKAFKASGFNDYVTSYLTHIIINAISFGVSFVVLSIILGIIVYVLNVISKLPILNGINKTAGLALGALEGLIVVWILCIVLTMFAGSEGGQNIYRLINESSFLSIIYNNNYLLRFVVNISGSLF